MTPVVPVDHGSTWAFFENVLQEFSLGNDFSSTSWSTTLFSRVGAQYRCSLERKEVPLSVSDMLICQYKC